MATSSTNFVSALGAGSGIDTKSLAENLVEAERAPRKEKIDGRIKKEEAKISGHGAMKYSLSQVQAALAKVNDASEFISITPANTQPGAFGVTSTASAQAGTYSIDVTQVAKATRLATTNFTGTSSTLNGGAPFDIDFNLGSGTQTVTVSTATPAGIVNAVNASASSTGISAQLVKTGSGYVVTFSGQTGAANAFTVSNLPSDVSMQATSLQDAQDALLNVNGLSITSTSNQVSDVIPGITLDLYAPTTSGTSARLDLNRQTASIKDNIKALVTAYNEFNDSMQVLGDRESKIEEFGGALAGDSLLTNVRNQIRGMLTKDARIYPGDDSTQTTLNPNVYAGRHVGLSFDRNGKLTLDETKLDNALSSHFEEVVTMFTANKNSQSIYSPAAGGLAGDAVKNIDKMLRSTGIIDAQTKTANTKIEQYKKELTQLEERMTALLNRYTKQFSVMDSIVGESNSTKTSLTSSFEGLMAMYTNG